MPTRRGTIPRAPRDLNALGRRYWRVLWTVGAPWLSETSHLEIVARLCRAQQEYHDLLDKISQTGFLTRGSSGQPVINPLWRMKEIVEARITRYESYCGLTPSDIGRFYEVVHQLAEEADPLEQPRNRHRLA